MPAAALPPDRLRRLLDVGGLVVGELRLDQVLDRVLETARELTGARYAALGVLDDERRALARFVTKGIDEDTRRAIGAPPRGHGILGVLIHDPAPLRLPDVAADARSYGLPAGHPPMRSFLGVPVLIRGEAWGNLYLTDKAGGVAFDDADEASIVVLARWAAIAIENAGLYETLDRRKGDLERAVRGFEATAAIAEAVGAETDLDRILELVVKRSRALVAARGVLVLLAEDDALVVAAAAGQVARSEDRVPVTTRAGEVLRRGEALRVDDVDADPLLDSAALGVPDAATALLVPLIYRGRALGVLCAFDRMEIPGHFDGDDEQALRAFAASAATAVATAKSVEADRLRAALASAEAERRRWARELHDETLQALGALKLLLTAAGRAPDPALQLAQAAEQVTGEIDNLRALITELRPASLDALGLAPALATLAERTAATHGLTVTSDVVLGPGRLDPDLETAVYRVAQEALTNVGRHARATHATLAVREQPDGLRLEIADDGVGLSEDTASGGFGLVGMRERVALAGGTLSLTGGAGTRVVATFPRQVSSPRSSA